MRAGLRVGEGEKIVGREHLPLDDREIDLNLIDPTGMNGSVYKKGIGPSGSDAIDGFLTTMSRAVAMIQKTRLADL